MNPNPSPTLPPQTHTAAHIGQYSCSIRIFNLSTLISTPNYQCFGPTDFVRQMRMTRGSPTDVKVCDVTRVAIGSFQDITSNIFQTSQANPQVR